MPFGKHMPSLGLFTDFYQLTMSQAYWVEAKDKGIPEQITNFELFFRKNPFEGGYAVSCGLQDAVDYLEKFSFDEPSIQFLREQDDSEGKKLFREDFLSYLLQLKFTCDIDAVPDGTVVFANQPLIRVTGPNIQAQLIETALLNIMNFQTLIATKAARIKQAGGNRPLAEFGLRRAQEEGGLSASYASYVGGADSTSNTMAAFLYKIPVKGTHAHSWVMSHDSELEAFLEYAKVMPGNCVFLVDTYDPIQGAMNAIKVALKLRENGHHLLAVRLDSGDLADLSIKIRKMLDDAELPDVKIIASNDLDEHVITALIAQGARIDTWGVGTKLVTSFDQPALGGVYKLTASERVEHDWDWKIKLSNPEKTTNPGRHQIRRYSKTIAHEPTGQPIKRFLGDAMFDMDIGTPPVCKIVHPNDPTTLYDFRDAESDELLLQPIYRNGDLVYRLPTIHESKARSNEQLAALNPTVKRLLNPEPYLAGLEESLYLGKIAVIREFKEVVRQRTGDEDDTSGVLTNVLDRCRRATFFRVNPTTTISSAPSRELGSNV